MKTLLALSLLLPLALSSCASPYGPLGWRGGYSDSKLNDDTFAVRFEGNGATRPDQVEELWLRRCADVASSNGYPYFTVVSDRSTANSASFKGSDGSYKASTTVRPDGLGGYKADSTGTYAAPTTTVVTRHVKSGSIVGYKEGSQPKGAYKASLILDRYK